MSVKYTKQFLTRLEDLFAETQYTLRYEKGSFKSGYCLLKEHHVAVVNKFFPLEGKINSLVDILTEVEIDTARLSEKNLKLYQDILKTRQGVEHTADS
jgi:hypothetical protein